MEVLFENKQITNPKVSVILLDWSCRESFHCLDYLNKQTISRQSYEIIWIEYYTRKAAEIEAKLKNGSKSPIIDQWIMLGMPENLYYHKHLMYNIGIVKSRGDIVVICDSDAIYEPSFVESIIQAFQTDPNIVLHLDQVRNTNKKFYPFSYPSAKKLLKKGCVNFRKGKTTGLWDDKDPLHSRNYGACMAALRNDLISVGGADEHIDFLGHVCGPYDMTFRLRNFGRREIWHEKEFLYHTWHPGQSGDGNYVGPHDGKLLSVTALEVLNSGRIHPLVENEAVRILRTEEKFADKTLKEKLINPLYIQLFNRDEILREGKMHLWNDHELIRHYRDFNIIRYKNKFYGVPAFLELCGIGKEMAMETEEKNHPTIISGENVRSIVRQIKKFDTSSLAPKIIGYYEDFKIIRYGRRIYGILIKMPGDINFHDLQSRSKVNAFAADTVEDVKKLIDGAKQSLYYPTLLDTYKECNIIKYLGRIYGIPRGWGKVDLFDPKQLRRIETLSADTVEAVKKIIDSSDRSIYCPILLDTYKEYNIIKYLGRIYGIPHRWGKVDLFDPEQLCRMETLSADTIEAVKRLIDKTSRSMYLPIVLDTYKGYNVVEYQGKVYGVPRNLGKVDFMKESERLQPGILCEDTQQKLISRIDNIFLLENYEHYNIVSFRSDVYGVPEEFGPAESICGLWFSLPGVLAGRNCNEVKKLIRSANRLSDEPFLLCEYKNYNVVRYNNCHYAVPHSIGNVDFSNREEQLHPEIISADNQNQLQVQIDKLEKTVPIEYAGWLPSFSKFGNCGSHPQFAHIKTPPEGYRFTYFRPGSNDKIVKKTFRQWIAFFVKRLLLLTAVFKLVVSAWSKGAKWHYIYHFLKTRDIKLQLLIPRKRKLLFLPSVPYILGQHPWVIEIEDPISLLFPFVHNGHTCSENFHKSPYLPVFKALFESKSCKAIITHVKSTAESLPKLFQSTKLASKVKHVPLGVKLPKVYHEAEKEDGKVRILFNNSWHQDSRNFFIRGGLDVLAAFDRLHKNYPNVLLTLRTSLPSMNPRYMRIIEQNHIGVIDRFLPDQEWETLMINSDIYLLPSDRIHVVSILEAMSYGLAVVASDGWGVQDYVEHRRNGMVVKGRYGKVTWMDDESGMLCENYAIMQREDPYVIDNMVEILSSLVKDKQLRCRLGRQAREDVKDKYNLENWNNGLKQVFDQIFSADIKI
ncbi:MAG: glycosyltransferase [Sedimentisphaerales bacterium]